MSSCQLMFPGVRSFLVFSSLGFKPPASGFQSYSYSSLKTFFFHTAMMIKTSRLMVQRLFTMRDTQRFTELHGEEKREEGDRGDQEEKRGDQKGRELSSQ